VIGEEGGDLSSFSDKFFGESRAGKGKRRKAPVAFQAGPLYGTLRVTPHLLICSVKLGHQVGTVDLEDCPLALFPTQSVAFGRGLGPMGATMPPRKSEPVAGEPGRAEPSASSGTTQGPDVR
jgi:hypothetical protein